VEPSVRLGKEKGKRLGLTLGPKELGRLVWPNRLGLPRGVSSACGSAGRLGSSGWLAHLRAGCVRGPAWASFISRIGPAPFSSSLAGLPLRLLLLADRTAPRVSLGGIRCGGSGSGAAGGRACVRAKVCVCGARRVLGERPQRLGRDANATSRPRRGVDAHGEAEA
jgi:hypothetical protein